MSHAKQVLRSMVVLLACAELVFAAGCAGSGSASVGYSYGAYYGSPWGPNYYYGGGPVYVGPPDTRPPQAAQLPSRPMPPSRPAGGAGRRR